MKRFISISILFLSGVLTLASCFKNDMPYPYLRGTIVDIDVEGMESMEIDELRNTVTLTMNESRDLRHTQIRSVTYGQAQTYPEKPIVGEQDLSSPLYVTLRTYEEQRYIWKIEARQSISRNFSIRDQVGKAVIDEENGRVMVKVGKFASLSWLKVLDYKLGPAEVTSYWTEDGSAPFDFASLTNFSEPVNFRVRYHDIDRLWTLYVERTDKNILINRVSPHSRCAWIDASGLAGQPNGVKFRPKNALAVPDGEGEPETEADEDGWTDVPYEAEGGDFILRIPDLEPQTTYEYFAYTGDEQTDVEAFTTEDEVQVPNGSFESVTNVGKYYEWYDALALEERDRTAWWGSGNGSSVMGISGSADMGYVICEPDEAVRFTGERSAKLVSRWAVVKFAAGNLFSGYFGGLEGTKGGKVNYGRPFTHRPDTLSCRIRYQCGKVNHVDESCPAPPAIGDNDCCQIFVALGTWNYKTYGGSPESPIQVNTTNMTTKFNPKGPDVIAYGEYTRKESTPAEGEDVEDGWLLVKIPLDYADSFTVPTHLVISFASSALGDYFTGSDQSVLWVDDVRLLY